MPPRLGFRGRAGARKRLAGGEVAPLVAVASIDLNATSVVLTLAPVPNQPPVAAITGPTDGVVIAEDGTLTLTGTGTDPEDGALSGASLAWSSDRDGPLGTGASLSLDANVDITAGNHEITLTGTDSGGLTGTDTIAVTVEVPVASIELNTDAVLLTLETPPALAITSPTDGAVFADGATISLRATATDWLGRALDASWSVDEVDVGTGDIDLVVGVDVSPGALEIVASVSDERGLTAAETVTIIAQAPAGTGYTIPLTTTRIWDTAGTGISANAVPLPAGYLSEGEESTVQVFRDGVEYAIYAEPFGRQADGSYASVYLEFEETVGTSDEIAVELRLGQATRTTTDRARTYESYLDVDRLPPVEWMNDPSLIGCPRIVSLPTDPAYLLQTSACFAPQVTRAEAEALPTIGADAALYHERLDRYLAGFHYEIATGNSGLPFMAKTLTAYPDPSPTAAGFDGQWSGAEPPAYYAWRQVVGHSSDAGGENYYDMAMIAFNEFARTGERHWWQKGNNYSWANAYSQRFTYNPKDSTTTPVTYSMSPAYGHQPHRYSPLGHAIRFLWTGDPDAKHAVEGLAARERGSTELGSSTAYWGEGRPIARIGISRLGAWACTRAETEAYDWAAEVEDWITRAMSGTARTAWPDPYWGTTKSYFCPATRYTDPKPNAFMLPQVGECASIVARVYPVSTAQRTLIVDTVAETFDWMWETLWNGGRDRPAFRQEFSPAAADKCSYDDWGHSPDLNNMYPVVYAWLAVVKADGKYRTMAERIFAVSTSYLPSLNNLKVSREQYCFGPEALAWIAQAPPATAIPTDVPDNLTVSPSTYEAGVDHQIQLTATVRAPNGTPLSGYDGDVVWSTSDPTVAIVSGSGLVTCEGDGVATISASLTGYPDATAGTLALTVSLGQFSTGFGDPLDPAVWTTSGGAATSGGVLSIPGGGSAETIAAYDLRGKSVTVDFGGATGVQFRIQDAGGDGWEMRFYPDATYGQMFTLRKVTAGSVASGASNQTSAVSTARRARITVSADGTTVSVFYADADSTSFTQRGTTFSHTTMDASAMTVRLGSDSATSTFDNLLVT